MKILLIDVNCKHSSTGKIVYDLYTALNNAGHYASVCYGRGPRVDEQNIFKFSSTIETYIHALLTRVTGLTGIYSPHATHELINYIKAFEPDVVHIHDIHGYFINIAPLMKYLKSNNIKTIWTFHCDFMYTGKCGFAYDCIQWQAECVKCPNLRDYPASLYFDFTQKMYNEKKRLFDGFNNLIIVAVSKWLADRVRQSFLKYKDVRVIHNGIDTDNIFYPRANTLLKKKHGLSNEKIALAVAPNIMEERKGGKWVLELAKRFHHEKIKFIMIGADQITGKTESNIIILRRTANQAELAEYYSLADVTILPSKKETFSLICAESLACGTPIIGFESGAPSEIAPNGFGEFVPYGDIDALEKEVRSFFEGKSKLRSKHECAEFGRHHYSCREMVNNYISLYSKCL